MLAPPKPPLRLVSLFAGIGGFDLGFERAGIETVAVVERDANCRKLLAAKFPKAQVFDDVCTVGKHNLPPCDIVVGGFPCQDLSVEGLRAGLAGKRSGLFYQLTRITNELQPAFLVWENVPGLLSSNNGRDFLAVLVELDRIGYSGAWRLLDAQHFGVAQRRRRIFGVFARGDAGAERCAEILSLQEGLRGHPPPRREAGQRPSGTISSRPSGGGGLGTDHELDGGLVPAVARSLCAGRDGYNDGSDQTYVAGALTSGGDGHSAGSATLQDAVSNQLVPQVARSLTAERGQRNNATEQNLIPEVSDPISASEGKTYTHEGKGNFRLYNVVATERSKGDAYKCGDCSHFGHQTEHATKCPRCDSPDGYWNVMIEPTIGPDAGKVFDFNEGRYKKRPVAFSAKDSGADAGELSPTLRAGNHDASHENGGVMPAIAFDATQITNPDNRSNPQPGGPCHPLASGAHAPAIAIQAGSVRENPESGPDGVGVSSKDTAYTLEARAEVQAVAFSARNRGPEPKVGRPERAPHAMTDKVGALDATKPWNVAFQARIARNGRGQPEPISPALNGANSGETSDSRPLVATTSVRRLTPRECERLQGFPDDWTAGFADSVRYRMCGNAVAVPCSEWIARRLVKSALPLSPLEKAP